jgi:hypothetical protein
MIPTFTAQILRRLACIAPRNATDREVRKLYGSPDHMRTDMGLPRPERVRGPDAAPG